MSSEPARESSADVQAELQWLYRSLQDLDRRIAAGEGSTPITALREQYLATYLSKLGAAAPSLPGAPAPAGVAAARPHGQPFSWSAFFAEQSIALLAYSGGFLLLVATLIFETGGWQAVGNLAKLAIITVVYLAFGGLGVALRGARRLQTVANVYLAVFALLTPLVALAYYLFALRGLGVPASGMLSLSACFAMVVYLLLALQTKLEAYGYLSALALVVAVLALGTWIGAPAEWWTVTWVVTALVLLVVRRAPVPIALERPAMVIAALVSVVAILGIEGQVVAFSGTVLAGQPAPFSQWAFIAAAVAALALAAAWGLTLRDKRAPMAGRVAGISLVGVADWLAAATGAQVAFAVAVFAGVTLAVLGYVLAVLALAEFGVALAVRARAPERVGLRVALAVLGVGLGVIGGLLQHGAGDPNWPLIAAFFAAALVAAGAAVLERQRWWIVVSGLALALMYHSIAASIAHAVVPGTTLLDGAYRDVLSKAELGFTLVVWLVAVGVGRLSAVRRYALPALVVALAHAIYVSTLVLTVPDARIEQTLVLGAFAVAALIAARLQNLLIAGGIVTGLFGAVAVLPLTFGETNGLVVALVGLAPGLLALAVRFTLGRRWAISLYAVALWAALAASLRLSTGQVSTDTWVALGNPFATWFMLAVTVVGLTVALLEGSPWVLVAPAVFAVLAAASTTLPGTAAVLAVAVALVGVGLRAWRGRWWDFALLIAGTLGALIAITRFEAGGDLLAVRIACLVAMALVGYAAVLISRDAPESTATGSALLFLPLLLESLNTEPTWAYTVALVVEAVVLLVIGLGVRGRVAPWAASAMLGIAALRGAVLAYQSGVPIAAIVAVLALLLLGTATWLSLRARHRG